MAIAMKVRAGKGEIRVLMTRPSENGIRKDAKSGMLVPAHFIKNVSVAINGKTVLDGQWGGHISKGSYFSFEIKNMNAGDKVTVAATDSMGVTGSVETSAS